MMVPLLDAPHARATMHAEVSQAAAGRPFLAAVEIATDPHWHVYWRNPGDSGIPTQIDWRAPEGWRVEPLEYPTPRQFAPGGITAYGYEGRTYFLARITPTRTPGTLSARVKWLVCANACVAGTAVPTLAVRVAKEAKDGRDAGLLRTESSALPRSVADWSFRAHQNLSVILEATPPKGAAVPPGKPTFFPFQTGLVDHAKPATATLVGGRLVLRMEPSPFPEKRTRVTGLLVAPPGETWPGGTRSLVVDAPLTVRR